MAEAFTHDIVKDVENKEGLKQLTGANSLNNLDEQNWSEQQFKDFDNAIETSFQQFLTKNNDRDPGKNMQELFNTWLDKEYINLYNLKNNEIANLVIKPISFELNTEATIIGLNSVQNSLNNNILQQLQNMRIFGSEVKKDYIAHLFSLKFKNRDELLNLLNNAKSGTHDPNIKQFQRMIMGRTDETHDKDRDTTLGTAGVDGNFGINTLKALEEYISTHLEGKLVLNTSSLTDNDVTNIGTYIEQNKESGELDLSNIESITTNIAKELANFPGTIDLTHLNNIDLQCLTVFKNGSVKKIQFPHGTLEHTNNNTTIKIDGDNNIYYNIDATICQKLINGVQNTEQPTNGSQNNSPESNVNGEYIINNDHAQALHEGFNYAKEINEIDEKELPKDEKDAIKLLTVGTRSSLVSRIFRLKGYNKNASIVDEDYDPMINKEERIRLKNLQAGLEACLDESGNLDSNKLTTALSNGGEKDLSNLKTLYTDFKAGNFGSRPYLERVMELIDDCFIQGGMTDNKGETIDTFTKLYTDLLIGNNYDLLAHKEKDVANLDDIKSQLNALETDILGDENDLDDKLTDEYKAMILSTENIQRLLRIDQGNFKNIYEKYSFQEKEGSAKEPLFKNLSQVKFACCLCDLNTDGKIDVADKGTKTGQELFNLILDAQIEGQDAMNNILNYALNYAKSCNHNNTLAKLQKINTLNDPNLKLDFIAQNPIIIQYLREMLTKTSIENTRSIIMNGSVESVELLEQEQRFWEYMMDPNMDKALDENLPEIIEEIKSELKNNNELNEEQKQELIKKLSSKDESIKRTLKIGLAGYVALHPGTGYGAGLSIPLWTQETKNRINSFSGGFYGGAYDGALLGLSLAYGNRRQNDRGTFARNSGIVAGADYNGGFSLLGLISTGPEFQLNYKKLQETLDVRSAKFGGINLIGMTNFSVLGAGGDISYRRDMLEGIEQISQDMNLKVFESLYKAYSNKGEKNFLDKQNFIELVTAQLKTDFPNTNDETLSNSANLFYLGLSYYVQRENGQEPTPAEMGKIFSNIAKDFQLNWKNTAIAALNGKIQLTGVSAGVIYIGKLVPIASITTTNYENLFAHDTQESRNSYEQNLYNESGMILHEEPNETGYIGKQTVNYLNKKLSIFFPGGKMPKINFSYNDLSEANPKQPYLSIPKELCKYIDISFCKELEGHIKESGDRFLVPANMKIGLSTYIGGGTMRANLILGDNKKNTGDTPLTAESTFDESADPFTYNPNSDVISLNNIHTINNKINELRKDDTFPLSSCERSNGGQLTFNMNQNISIDPSSTNMLRIHNGQLFLNNPNGELTISKDINGSYVASFEQGAPNEHKFSIRYNTYSRFEGKFDFHDSNLDNLFNNIEKELSTFDDNEKKQYSDFMEKAIGETYIEAFNSLKTLLKKAEGRDSLKNFYEYLNKENLTEYQKMQVVDRFKAIFSYNKGLDTYQGVRTILGRRKDTYKTLTSRYTEETLPLDMFNSKDYRDAVLKRLEEYNNSPIPRKENLNLIGMTAFYRTDNQNGKGYMLTQLGGTKVLGDVTIPIEQTYLEQTQNWLISSLEKNEMHEKVLFDQITNKLKVDQDKIRNYTATDIHNKLSGLLRGDTVDIGGKIVKIKTNYVFYLLGECANESIGVEIDGVEENSYADSVSVEIDTSGSSAGLYVKSQAAENQMGISANNMIWGISGSRGRGPNSLPGSGGPNSLPGSGGLGSNNTPNNYGP